MHILFVRHAQSTGNAEGRLQGRAEYGLSEAGLAEAAKLRDRLRAEDFQPSHVYSSPQRRAAQTAEVVVAGWQLSIKYLDDLREHDMGVFSGLTWAEIAAKYPDLSKRYHETRDWDLVEGAETLQERQDRARRVVDGIMERHDGEDKVLLFTHGGILQRMLAELMGAERTWGVPVRNTALFGFELDASRWRENGTVLLNTAHWQITHFNDAGHLD